jgi:AbrB family looped-hinge helix DNA binding protein
LRTTLSTKGQIVLPGSLRSRLGLHPGDAFSIKLDNGSIVLTPLTPRKFAITIGIDATTHLPVAVAESGAPLLTSEDVAELLAGETYPIPCRRQGYFGASKMGEVRGTND